MKIHLYKCINGWTKEKMIAHFTKEFKGKSSIDPNDTLADCKYRLDGKKCVAGVFIPDKVYKTSMEDLTIDFVCKEHPKVEKCLPLIPSAMSELQAIHDESRPSNTKRQILAWIKKNVVGK